MDFNPSRDYAVQLDQRDPLASYQKEFAIDDPDLIYLDGDSPGCLTKAELNVSSWPWKKNGASAGYSKRWRKSTERYPKQRLTVT